MPPQNSSISSRAVMPAGASLTPGFLMRPDTEKLRSPLRPLRPWLWNQAAPFSTISRTQYTVSTLWIRVGRPNRPTWDGKGGLCRGSPRLPSIDSSIADSSPQVNARRAVQSLLLQRGDLPQQDLPHRRIFVAQIDVDVGRLHHPGRDQHALEKAMRIGLEIDAVLDRPGLALVGIDRHQPRRRFLAHEPPLTPRRKPGAAEPAQAR